MDTKELTDFDIATMAQMVLSLIKSKGLDESIAGKIIDSLKEEYGLTPPILW